MVCGNSRTQKWLFDVFVFWSKDWKSCEERLQIITSKNPMGFLLFIATKRLNRNLVKQQGVKSERHLTPSLPLAFS